MKLGDKILYLRKSRGWSQEELANKLCVSRQSVSKWESSMATPDLERIVDLSELFDISTDVLVKDSVLLPEANGISPSPTLTQPALGINHNLGQQSPARLVNGQDAAEFLALKKRAAAMNAIGVTLCILSILPLLGIIAWGMLNDMDEKSYEPHIVIVGVPLILVIVAFAVMLFLRASFPLKRFAYMEKEEITLPSDVEHSIRTQFEEFAPRYMRALVVGISLSILSAIPAVVSSVVSDKPQSGVPVLGVMGTLSVLALGVFILVRVITVNEAFQQLLQEEDYTVQTTSNNAQYGPVRVAFWLLILVVYLVYSVVWDAWSYSWLVWVGAVPLFLVLQTFLRARAGHEG